MESEPRARQPTIVYVFAAGAGLMSATIHLAQPLLPEIGRTFGKGPGATGLLLTFAQIGYAVGLFLVVPLADAVRPRLLIPVVTGASAVALAAAAGANSLTLLRGCALAIGIAATAGQLMLAATATMTPIATRGRTVGIVMSGLLTGILLARVFSGSLASLTSWRTVYVVAAVAAAVLAVVLWKAIPTTVQPHGATFGSTIRSLFAILRDEPVVRRRALLGALCFAGFNGFWVAVPFLLAGAPFHYSEWEIGALGLLGVAGIAAAPLAGRVSDRGGAAAAATVAIVCVIVSFGAFLIGRHHIAGIVLGVLLLDGGFQALQVANQTAIYRAREDAHGRVTSIYMGCVFAGGAMGSAISIQLYASSGWGAVCLFGAVLSFAALLLVSARRL